MQQYHSDNTKPYNVELNQKGKGKVLPYSQPSVGHGADPGVQAVNPQITSKSSQHWAAIRLLYARPAVTFPPATSTKLYCLVTEAHRCEQVATQLCHGENRTHDVTIAT